MSKQYFPYDLLDLFFKNYLVERNVEKTLELVTDDVYIIGSGEGQVALNKDEFREYLMSEISDVPDSIGYEIREYNEWLLSDLVVDSFCDVDIIRDMGVGDKSVLKIRVTVTVVQQDEKSLISGLHISQSSSINIGKELLPLRYFGKGDENYKAEILDIIKDLVPGGLIGGFLEESLPVSFINNEMLQMLGYTYDEFFECTGGYMSSVIHENDVSYVYTKIKELFSFGNTFKLQYRMKKKTGEYIWVSNVGKKVETKTGIDGLVGSVMDISDDINDSKSWVEKATKDDLTGSYNRRYTSKFMNKYFEDNEDFAFLMMDIDNFKGVNDTYGHLVGDEILMYIACLLQVKFKENAVVCRLGGDEFVVFLTGKHDKEYITEKISEVRYEYDGITKLMCPDIKTGISFGGVYGKANSTLDFDRIYVMADNQLYSIKRGTKGKTRLVCYK